LLTWTGSRVVASVLEMNVVSLVVVVVVVVAAVVVVALDDPLVVAGMSFSEFVWKSWTALTIRIKK